MNHLLTPEISAGIQCSECHIPVNSFYDSTHIDRSNPDNRAEIKFGPLAKKIIFGGYIPNPKYDSVDYECSNVYCHGGFAGGNVMVVTWTNPDNVVCGSCHGSPTTGNPNPRPYAEYTHDINNTITDCAECHFATIDATGKIIHPENHINGVVNFGENR
jgi:predicted CxxxxCH...CXXCH cytochrome family protein